jgi:ABC-type lipoprotein export system ATPase subunit
MMRIEKFRVQGYKNLTHELVMDELRGYNVIHGVNNIGKSNLLEAMSLLMQPSKTISKDATPLVGKHKLEIEGWIPGILGESEAATPADRLLENQSHRILFNGIGRHGTLVDRANRHSFSAEPFLKSKRSGPMRSERFMLIPVSRALNEKMRVEENRETSLALEMYDAQQSEDIGNVKRWRAFVEAMKAFQDITGPGEFVATYQRESKEAQLMFEMQDARIPFRLLGSGMQQIVQLLGMILMSNASIIAIEEPELNLRWALQTRLAATLRQLLENPDAGIDQIFITSHSPAFSDEPDFWLMRKGEAGPIIERRPSADLALVLQDSLTAAWPELPKHEIDGWLTPEGVMKVPPRVQKLLKLEHGGAVSFLSKQGGVLLQNEHEALANAGLAEPANDA